MENDPMKNFVQDGGTITATAPYVRTSGQAALIGTLLGVATADIANAADGEWATVGVFDLTKIGSQAWTQGACVYWDNTNKRCTTVASGNTLIGACVVAVDNAAGSTTGRVRLNGVARPAEA
jgi:predicted RecA/RadA family phage recombinase